MKWTPGRRIFSARPAPESPGEVGQLFRLPLRDGRHTARARRRRGIVRDPAADPLAAGARRDGSHRMRAARAETTPARVAVALAPIDPSDVFLYHKTTNRTPYEQAKRPEFDDVILWNPDGQVTESTLGNVAAEIDGRKVTPPVSCGLLAGTFREQLLDEGAIEEGLITLDQLRTASRLWLINSVREWWPAALDRCRYPSQRHGDARPHRRPRARDPPDRRSAASVETARRRRAARPSARHWSA